jgi:hypothetical protein
MEVTVPDPPGMDNGRTSAAVSHKVLWITMENHSYAGVIGKPVVAVHQQDPAGHGR